MLSELNKHITELYSLKTEMEEARKRGNQSENIRIRAKIYSEEVKPYMDKIRYHADKIEMMVDNQDWPLPKYRELLFIR